MFAKYVNKLSIAAFMVLVVGIAVFLSCVPVFADDSTLTVTQSPDGHSFTYTYDPGSTGNLIDDISWMGNPWNVTGTSGVTTFGNSPTLGVNPNGVDAPWNPNVPASGAYDFFFDGTTGSVSFTFTWVGPGDPPRPDSGGYAEPSPFFSGFPGGDTNPNNFTYTLTSGTVIRTTGDTPEPSTIVSIISGIFMFGYRRLFKRT
jgi:hypothetical protein